MSEDRVRLNRVLERADVIALALGTMVGWAWVMLVGVWVSEAGMAGAILAFGAGALLCILVGMAYAELTAALPLAGGEMVYTYRSMGYAVSWVSGWTVTFAYLGVAAWEGIALATAVDYIFEIPRIGYIAEVAGYPVYISWAVVGSVCAMILTLLNYLGTKPAAIFQVMMTGGLIFVGLMFVLGGISFGDAVNAMPFFTSKTGFVVVMLMVPSMLIGFDIIPQSVEEMNIPLRDVSKMLIFSIVLAALWYIAIIIGMSLAAPPEIRDAGIVPAADAMAYAYGHSLFGNILIFGGICGILTSWNGFIMGATRIVFAMGRARMLPAVFGKLHSKYKTPAAAILLAGSICFMAPFLGRNALIWFVNVSAFSSVVVYLLVMMSFMLLRKREPELVRPYKIRAGYLVGAVTMSISCFFIVMRLPFNNSPFADGASVASIFSHEVVLTSCWFLLGLGLAAYAKVAYRKVGAAQREILVFGEEYARKEVLEKS